MLWNIIDLTAPAILGLFPKTISVQVWESWYWENEKRDSHILPILRIWKKLIKTVFPESQIQYSFQRLWKYYEEIFVFIESVREKQTLTIQFFEYKEEINIVSWLWDCLFRKKFSELNLILKFSCHNIRFFISFIISY